MTNKPAIIHARTSRRRSPLRKICSRYQHRCGNWFFLVRCVHCLCPSRSNTAWPCETILVHRIFLTFWRSASLKVFQWTKSLARDYPPISEIPIGCIVRLSDERGGLFVQLHVAIGRIHSRIYRLRKDEVSVSTLENYNPRRHFSHRQFDLLVLYQPCLL